MSLETVQKDAIASYRKKNSDVLGLICGVISFRGLLHVGPLHASRAQSFSSVQTDMVRIVQCADRHGQGHSVCRQTWSGPFSVQIDTVRAVQCANRHESNGFAVTILRSFSILPCSWRSSPFCMTHVHPCNGSRRLVVWKDCTQISDAAILLICHTV